jgi:ABC-type branched-subunit amino acid transport system ATPase component
MPTSSVEARDARLLLKISGLSAGYGPVPVIHDLDAGVGAGEVVAVIGPNGAGKSTLLKAVLGVLAPMAGQITLDGKQIGGKSTDRIARLGVGYVPQVKDVFETLTVRENLEMGGYSLPRRQVDGRIEEIFGLYPALAGMRSRHGGHLSGGERKMLAMGRVMMTKPTLLVLDEPTAGLSPQLAHELLHVHVRRLAETGASVLLVEQHAREALAISDWSYVLASGRVLRSESAAALLEQPDLGQIFLGQVAGAKL